MIWDGAVPRKVSEDGEESERCRPVGGESAAQARKWGVGCSQESVVSGGKYIRGEHMGE